jgi:hypothetical protein
LKLCCTFKNIAILPDFYVYHVDISSSRGFDKLEYYNTIVQSSESNDEAIRNDVAIIISLK